MIKEELQKVSDFLWEIPLETQKNMQVPARLFAFEEMLDAILGDRSLNQLINVACLNGIQHAAIAMPDIHEGYGFPIGGVAAMKYPDGVISPGGIGYDINCGVRLLLTPTKYPAIKDHLDQVSNKLYELIPCGPGKNGPVKLNLEELDKVLLEGASWAVDHNWAFKEDLKFIESNGKLAGGYTGCVSHNAKRRGLNQLGTIGGGNHFVEVDRVVEIFDEEKAKIFNLEKDMIVVLIHTGSRGLGYQVATDHLRGILKAMPAYGINIPDRELACVPFNSPEGQDYYKAMICAANYAWCNRSIITWSIREVWKSLFGISPEEISILYDVAHNIAKIEDHNIQGRQQKLIVHRKGATRAFGPGSVDIPKEFNQSGQPVLIPGSMGTSSYVLAGTSKSMELSFGSSCHGAGRRMSRRAVKKQVDAPSLQRALLEKGIYVKARSYRGLAEEAPKAYKDIEMVVETVHHAEIATKVAKLQPLAVIKG